MLGYQSAEAQAFYRQARSAARGRFYRLRTGGVESYYNGLLAGHRGYAHPLEDAQGRAHGSWTRDTLFQDGQDLHLTIDVKLQAYAEKLLGNRKGYLVALDPRTGEILAFVSGPVYPASTITAPDQAGTRAELLDSDDRPLLNRPAMLANPPGSVFKLVNAAVALQLGAITPRHRLPLRPVADQLRARPPGAAQPHGGPPVQLQPLLLPGDAQPD